ncbi:hypothetical protein RFI_31741 [Reticulomyxa filosa]|uniref:Uncharacterized protein n=1 Tax=Reticulomyxa filosa TaxID=46433 RepID=X6LY47_RETFI|nr:hypothetical protein RFI_31741 [Reticulomyxa filosa]|eukprot:ETO05655.1 hypothetical protein RFI_31741 [Reticulomyxa filosa]
MGNDAQKLEEEKFQLRWNAKQLANQSKKFEKEHDKYKKKAAEAMQKGQFDIARIHAGTAIHQRNMANKTLQLSSRLDAVYSKITSAEQMQKASKLLANVSKTMGETITDEQLTQMTRTMDQFTEKFEQLDIESKVMENALNTTTATTFDERQVDALLKEIATENAMDVDKMFQEAGVATHEVKENKEPETTVTDEERALENRLQKLMQS